MERRRVVDRQAEREQERSASRSGDRPLERNNEPFGGPPPGTERTPGRPERRMVSVDSLRDGGREQRGYRRGGHHGASIPSTAPLGPPTSYVPPPPPPKPKKEVVIAEPGTASSPEALQAEADRDNQLRERRGLPGQLPKKPKPARTKKEPQVEPGQICKILYQDDHIVIVDKAAGYPVTPSGAFSERSVLRALAAEGLSPLYPASLLDPEATGLVALSRSEVAARAMRWNWRSKLCKRQYLAVAQGDVTGGRGRIATPIGAVLRGSSLRHQVLSADGGGRPAETFWKLLARGRGMSRLLITIGAGRCHQIRIHLASIGHPIVGDRLYARSDNAVPLQQLLDVPSKYRDIPPLPPNQIALHCYRIEMPHPITQQDMTWTAEIPRALLALMPGAWVVDAG